jgi:acid stress-induced BolA-like protein IbaG/YrbA
MDRTELERLLTAAFPGGEVKVSGDDGVHFEARVVSPAFAGKSLIEQHQLVYAALGDLMKETIHALSLKTFTPEVWARRRSGAA